MMFYVGLGIIMAGAITESADTVLVGAAVCVISLILSPLVK